MAANPRRQNFLLAALVVVFLGVIVYQFWPGSTTLPGGTATRGRPAAAKPNAPTSHGAESTEVMDVQVGRLEAPPPDPGLTGRNPFRFRPKPPPAPPQPVPQARPGEGDAGGAADPAVPPPPPPPPPIALKFIGTVDAARRGRVAVLSDGKYVYYGREGDIIDGRFRVVKIGEESIQMEYVDGRGRQTIRLSGA